MYVVYGIQFNADITASIPILLAEARTHVGQALLYNIMVHLAAEQLDHLSFEDVDHLRNIYVQVGSPVYHPNSRVVPVYKGFNVLNEDFVVVGGNGNGGFFADDGDGDDGDDDGGGGYVDYAEHICIIVTRYHLNIVFDDDGNIVDTFIGDENGNDDGDENGNDDGDENGNDDGDENGNDDGDENGNDDGDENGNDEMSDDDIA